MGIAHVDLLKELNFMLVFSLKSFIVLVSIVYYFAFVLCFLLIVIGEYLHFSFLMMEYNDSLA